MPLWHVQWSIAAEVLIGLLIALSGATYVNDALAGRTKPQRASWAVFAALAAAATGAQVAEHGITGGSVMTGVSAVGFTVIAVVSIKHGVGGTSVTDRIVLAGLVVALGIWALAGNHPLVLPLLIAVEVPAIIVTIVKVVRLPGTETAAMWMVEGLASLVAVAAAPGLDSSMMFPAYNATVNLAVLATIWWTSPVRHQRVKVALRPRRELSDHRLMTLIVPADHLDRPTVDPTARADSAARADATAAEGSPPVRRWRRRSQYRLDNE